MNTIQLYCEDSYQVKGKGMHQFKDGEFDLAIVDPVYGHEGIQGGYTSGKGGGVAKQKKYNQSIWDIQKTGKAYFNELNRISENQIIWGGNYFVEYLKPSMGWIFWDKRNGDVSFSDGEFAFTSFQSKARIFKYRWSGMLQQDMKNKEKRIHPTQKPIQLYKWLLKNYAKSGDKILDTHFGSLSIGIACIEMGFDLTAFEIDRDYFNAAVKRIWNHINQLNTFIERPEILCDDIPIEQYIKQIL